jgi:ribA/ribD-fused uncharacterized protein
MEKAITQFKEEHDFLSNFYPATIIFKGSTYATSEHLYQAAKAQSSEDAEKVRSAITPGKAKRVGRRISMRDDFDDIKINVMRAILDLKFTQHPDLKLKLIQTGNCELIEGNYWHDTFWGVCNRKGENHLGKLLMALRKKFQDEV